MRQAATIAAIVLWAGSLHAQESGDDAPHDYSSPRRFMFELRFGSYSPHIDSAFDGKATPFHDLFGDGKALMFGGELEVEVFQRFGTLAVGGAIGYYKNSAKTLIDTGNDTTPSNPNGQRSAFDTTLNLLPLSLLAVYRFDLMAVRWRVPFVPYAKVGLNYTFWWIDKGNGDTATFNGSKAVGGTFGWQLNLGGAVLLDVLEPRAAKALDNEIGINHTYLYFEYIYFAADGLGKSSALRVGDSATWAGGLAFEF
jgi:hypothetical protein